jgi:D-sedoheptulose 7-phosphate isomerase
LTGYRSDLHGLDPGHAGAMLIRAFSESAKNFTRLAEQSDVIARIAIEIGARVRRGGCVMFCGNGGSAADAQHLAAELQGRYLRERAPLAAVALSSNTSTVTAIGNDYGFDEIFERQIRGLGRPSDAVVGISTSGKSRNVIRALTAAKSMGLFAVGLTGQSGELMADCSDALIRVPSDSTPRIQEMHIAVGHMICQIIEDSLF